MKRFFVIVPLLLLLLSGCFFSGVTIRGSGRIVTSECDINDFQTVSAADAVIVNITWGSVCSANISCDDNVLQYVDVYSDGNSLHVRMLPGYNFVNTTVQINITMPSIYALDADDASSIQLSGFTLPGNLNISATDASTVRLYLTDASDLDMTVEDASYLEVHSVYPVEQMNIGCSDASTADLGQMTCLNGIINVSEASKLKVNMNGSLTGQVTAASVLYYRGTTTPGPILFSGASGIVYY